MTRTDGTVLRIVASFLWTDGNVNQNVFNAVVTGGGAPWDDQDILDDAEAWCDVMYANLVARMSEEIDGNYDAVYKYDSVHDEWDEGGSNSWAYEPTDASEQLTRGVAGHVRGWANEPVVTGKKV